jgi:hypothetical protein
LLVGILTPAIRAMNLVLLLHEVRHGCTDPIS